MSARLRAAALLLLAGPLLTITGSGAEEAETEASEVVQLAQEVRSAEIAFAATMAERDMIAFAEFLAEDAIFLGDHQTLRGRDEVVRAWSRYFEGGAAPFSWEPARVEVLDSGDLALSTGPVRDPGGEAIGTFTTIWRREHDGIWKVIFDRGCPVCPEP